MKFDNILLLSGFKIRIRKLANYMKIRLVETFWLIFFRLKFEYLDSKNEVITPRTSQQRQKNE